VRTDPFGEGAVRDAAPLDGGEPVVAGEPVAAAEQAAAPAVAADSPLARLRTAYGRRRREAELYLPVPGWEDHSLVARVTVPHDDRLRALTSEVGTIEWAADFVAVAVAGLYSADGVDEQGEPRLTPLPGIAGPLSFDAEFGAAIGAEDVRTPRAAVLAAFTSGGQETPPVLNVLELADFAAKVDRWLTDTTREIAEAIVPGR